MVSGARAKMNSNLTKIEFNLNPEDQQEVETETLWAKEIGPNLFQIENSPFFIFGISADDVVSAEEDGGILRFRGAVSRGGHSTYRVFLQDGRTINSSDFMNYWQPIGFLGATFENANNSFVSVDIPPGKDVAAIYALLQKGEDDGVWAFEEAHYGGPPMK